MENLTADPNSVLELMDTPSKIIGLVLLLAALATASSRPWELRYKCEPAARSFCKRGGLKAFQTHGEAIDWIQANYTYVPLDLAHGKVLMPCITTYLNGEDEDPITKLRKAVVCETPERLDERFGEGQWEAVDETIADEDTTTKD